MTFQANPQPLLSGSNNTPYNPQIFPSPTAEPDAAKIKAKREENSPLCIMVFLLVVYVVNNRRYYAFASASVIARLP